LCGAVEIKEYFVDIFFFSLDKSAKIFFINI